MIGAAVKPAATYGAAGVLFGLLRYGPDVAAWPVQAWVVTIVWALVVAVAVEGLIWLVEQPR